MYWRLYDKRLLADDARTRNLWSDPTARCSNTRSEAAAARTGRAVATVDVELYTHGLRKLSACHTTVVAYAFLKVRARLITRR